jgi:hypothetical protein
VRIFAAGLTIRERRGLIASNHRGVLMNAGTTARALVAASLCALAWTGVATAADDEQRGIDPNQGDTEGEHEAMESPPATTACSNRRSTTRATTSRPWSR